MTFQGTGTQSRNNIDKLQTRRKCNIILWLQFPLNMRTLLACFYRKSVLFIDGKNKNIDGKQENHKLRRRIEHYAEIKSQKGKHSIEM
jgi:hypothetical protein